MGARLALVIAAALLAACAEMPKSPPTEADATAEAGYGRAFGRVHFIRGGKEADLSAGFFSQEKLTLFVRAVGDAQLEQLDVAADGTFVWPLKAGGEYEFVAYRYTRASAAIQRLGGRLMTRFAVPRAGQAVYVGDLRIDDRSGLRILDRFEEALKQVQSSLAEAKLQPVRSLMQPEPRAGSYHAVVPICSTVAWKISCSGSYQGVEAVLPPETGQGYPVTESLTPLLEWKPAEMSGVRYDVAIYESLALSGPDLLNRARVRGSLVAYAQGLSEPKYTPPPLVPGRKYEWTVRLRNVQDVVSTWSTTSYTLFAIVAAARGSGRTFGFETPSK